MSLLEANEVAELELDQESAHCRLNDIEVRSFPIPNRGVPTSHKSVYDLTGSIKDQLTHGRSVAIHCRAGIGRSSLIAACVLTQLGFDSETALALIGTARGVRVPDTDEQHAWVMQFQKEFPYSSAGFVT